VGTEEEKLAAFRQTRDQLRQTFEAYAAGRADAAKAVAGV